uniref:Uncharacterized protein n=1 Tax=Setaria italica TaxID=4555 RepID=K3ZFN3_SETIT
MNKQHQLYSRMLGNYDKLISLSFETKVSYLANSCVDTQICI